MEQSLKMSPWYYFISILALLWNAMSLVNFYYQTFISTDDLAKLSSQEQILYGEYPTWISFLYAVAVLSGFVGSIGLIGRKKWSQKILVLSLCTVIPLMIHHVLFTSVIQVYGIKHAIMMPMVVILIALGLVFFAGYSKKKFYQWN